MGLVGCGSALLWQMPIPQPRSAPRSVLGRYRGPAVEIGARALADRAWLEAAKQRLAQDVARLDQILREAGMRVLGGTMLFRLVNAVTRSPCSAALARPAFLSGASTIATPGSASAYLEAKMNGCD